MNAIICELCGSNDVVKKDGLYICQHCGTKYTVEEAKKLIGTVKIDRTDETEKLLTLARRAREEKTVKMLKNTMDLFCKTTLIIGRLLFFRYIFKPVNVKLPR